MIKSILAVALITLSISSVTSAFKLHPRIINGISSTQDQFPYYAFLKIDKVVESEICGGTIISKEWILTAAHCVRRAKEVSVLVGSWKLPEISEKHRQEFKVDTADILIHENFHFKTAENDIALIYLPKQIEFNEHVKPVNLSSTCDSTERLYSMVIGNGLEHEKGLEMPDVLKWAPQRTTTNLTCKKFFPFISAKQRICTVNVESGEPCFGDSGGPLVRLGDEALLGVLSFTHSDGCSSGRPQVFSNVFHYYSWISEITSIKLPRCE